MTRNRYLSVWRGLQWKYHETTGLLKEYDLCPLYHLRQWLQVSYGSLIRYIIIAFSSLPRDSIKSLRKGMDCRNFTRCARVIENKTGPLRMGPNKYRMRAGPRPKPQQKY